MSFDDAVSAKPESTTPGRYEASLSDDWSIGAGVNGGLLLALLGNTLRSAVTDAGGNHPDPVSISATYLSAATAGPAYLDTEVVRTGRSVSTGAVALHQVDDAGRPVERLRATATYADLAALADPDDPKRNLSFRTMPQVPPPEECFGNESTPQQFLDVARMLTQFELRLTPDSVGWAAGQPSRTGRLSGWFRLPDGREPDPIALLLVVDALPPVTFDLGLPGWAPTLSLTANVRARPAPGWLFVTHATRTVAGGMFEEDAEVWDSAGTLVAESRQLAMVPKRR